MLTKRNLMTGGSALLALSALPAWAQEKKKYIIQVPISFDSGGRPVVDLFIGQAGPYRFMIDTGAFGAMIRDDLAKTLKLGTHGVITVGGLAGRPEREYIYAATDVLMGNIFKLPNIDMVGAPKLPHVGIDGILPASILTALPTELDFEAALVRYYLNGAPQDLTGFSKLEALSQADTDGGAEKIYAHVMLDGRKLLCLVDTGADGHLFLSGAYVSTHGLWNKYSDAGQSGTAGVTGEGVKTRIVKIANFEFGPAHFDDTWVTLGDPGGLDNLLNMGVDGIIGDDILRQFTLAFAPHHEVYVKPNSRFSPLAGARPMVRHAFDTRQPVLPFLYRDDRRILLFAKVGDTSVGCLLDTGLGKSAIGPTTAQTLGLATVDGGFDGSALALAGLWHPPHLILEGRTQLEHRQPAIDLGLDFLLRQATRLDFDLNELTLFPDGAADLTGYNLFAERKDADSHGPLVVTVKLAGVDTVCLVDTATQASLALLPHAVKARNLWDALPVVENHTTPSGAARLVKMDGFDAGGLHRDMTPVLMSDPAGAEAAPYDARLGMGFLHRCNWIFTPDGKVYAKPNTFWSAT